MSSALDMSLDDIIKTKGSGGRGGRGGRGGHRGGRSDDSSRPYGPARNFPRQDRDRDQRPYRPAPVQEAPLNIAAIRQSVPDGSKMQVSNLDHRVSAEDLKLVFSTRVGPLKKCTLMYNEHGKPTGTALVHFERVGDAAIAYQRFNTVPLDGRPMTIEIILAPAAVPAFIPPPYVPRHSMGQGQGRSYNHYNQNHSQGQGHGGRFGRGGGGGGRGGRGGRSHNSNDRQPKKTAEQLDAEMTDYMQVDE